VLDDNKLKRGSAGRYTTRDGRFSVEQSSGRWMVVDAETSDELGLPLVRGPFATLDEARAAIEVARSGPAPTSNLADRIAAMPQSPKGRERSRGTAAGRSSRAPVRKDALPAPARAPRPPRIELRDFEAGDGPALRAFWADAGLKSVEHDDRTLGAFAERNPGLLVLATADDEIVSSALAGWDGRQGRMYDVATAQAHRRNGLATRLVRRLEGRLRALGCANANVTLPDHDDDAARGFWNALGYVPSAARELGKAL
jgi:GNAT superfamily N-acetyltransferase